MTNRILDISDQPVRLSVKHQALQLKPDNADAALIAFDDIAVIVVSNREVSYTHSVLQHLLEAGGIFVTCDASHLPIGMILPLQAHHRQVTRFSLQAGVSEPTKKRAWQQIVKAKIRAQGRALQRIHGDDAGVIEYAKRVKSGDPQNIEAQAAKRYWQNMFAGSFRRSREGTDENPYLNYGYAVLRAIVARAICAAGLHPCLGLHHHNQYSMFCLADDLMEPLRPIVDQVVHQITAHEDTPKKLDSNSKQALLKPLLGRYQVNSEKLTLFEISNKMAASLIKVFEGKARTLDLPEV
jgi:CRISPR-associated protein Cas1